jgi:hypothetical protein
VYLDIFEIVLAGGVGVIRGILAKNGSSVGIELDSYKAGAAPNNVLALLCFPFSLLLINLSATGSLTCTDKKLGAREHAAPMWALGVGSAKLDAMCPLFVLAPIMEVFQ